MYWQRIFSGGFSANTYILADEEKRVAVLIDPGFTEQQADEVLGEKGFSLDAVIDTHGHVDHIHNNRYFVERYGARLLIHPDDAPCLTDPEKNLGAAVGCPVVSPPADGLLRDGDILRVGDMEVSVWHTPGHTPGSITLQAGPVIFVGDLVFDGSVGRTDLCGGDTQQLMDTLSRRILPLPDGTVICSGHGTRDTTIGEQKRTNPFFVELMRKADG